VRTFESGLNCLLNAFFRRPTGSSWGVWYSVRSAPVDDPQGHQSTQLGRTTAGALKQFHDNAKQRMAASEELMGALVNKTASNPEKEKQACAALTRDKALNQKHIKLHSYMVKQKCFSESDLANLANKVVHTFECKKGVLYDGATVVYPRSPGSYADPRRKESGRGQMSYSWASRVR
jgi:hypothetical protein